MTKEDWIRKLTSRKFWLALAGLVAGLVAFFKHPTSDGEAITALIMALGSVIAYCVGEGLADAAGAHADQTITYIMPEDLEEPLEEPEEKPPEEK